MVLKDMTDEHKYKIDKDFADMLNGYTGNALRKGTDLFDATGANAYMNASHQIPNQHDLVTREDHLEREVYRLKLTIIQMQKEMNRKLTQMADLHHNITMPIPLPGPPDQGILP